MKHFECFVWIVSLIVILVSPLSEGQENIFKKWIKSSGYPVEEHFVKTEDDYVLRLYRIHRANGINNTVDFSTRGPILLTHGITYSGTQWVRYPTKSLAFLLANDGFDVWLYSARGTSYSLGHNKLNSFDPKYWDFSWHEMGYYDIPATLDYILNVTKSEKLHYVGHSQGCSSLLVALTMRPEYNQKVTFAYFIAPAAIIHPSLGSRTLTILQRTIATVGLPVFPTQELLSPCPNSLAISICIQTLAAMLGPFANRAIGEKITYLTARYMIENVAVKQLTHYMQLVHSQKFQMFDYGQENGRRYKRSQPPEYDLSLVDIPIILKGLNSDTAVNVKSVRALSSRLRNVTHFGTLPGNHIEFLFNIKTMKQIRNEIIKYTNSLSTNHQNAPN